MTKPENTQQNTQDLLRQAEQDDYKYGFVTDIDTEIVPPGLDEQTIRTISRLKHEPEWLLEFRLRAYRHWLTMTPPHWGHLNIPPIDLQAISYYACLLYTSDAADD